MGLIKTIKTDRNVLKQKNMAIENLLNKLENQSILNTENQILKNDLNELNQMAQQDLKMQETQINKLQKEILSLSSKNVALNQENKDLIALLEDKECDVVNTLDNFIYDGSLHHEIEKYVETNNGNFENEIVAKNEIIKSLTNQIKECEDILSETVQKFLLVQVIDLDLSDDEELDDLEGQNGEVLSFQIAARLKLQITGLCEQLETFHDKINGWRQKHHLREISIGTYLQKQVEHFDIKSKQEVQSVV